MRKTRSMVIRINAFTGSRNKFVAATIDTGKRYWMRRLSVSLGINTANASKGEKFAGRPINLLTIIN